MTALYIIFTVLAVLLLLLLLPIRIYLSYDGSVCAFLSVFGIRFPLYPRKKRKGKTKKAARKKKKSASPPTHKEQEKAKSGVSRYLKNFRFFLTLIQKIQKKLRGAFKIEILRMRATVATGDAASTAILYGVVSQGFSYVLALADTFLKTKYSPENIYLAPDYTAEKTDFKIKIRFSSNLFHLTGAAFHTILTFLKEKNKSKNTVKTEENEHG